VDAVPGPEAEQLPGPPCVDEGAAPGHVAADGHAGRVLAQHVRGRTSIDYPPEGVRFVIDAVI